MNEVCTVNIAGRELRLIQVEDEESLRELAARLDAEISETVMSNGNATKFDGALLCALNAMDEAAKAQSMVRKLREDNARLLDQLSKLRNNGRR